MANDPEKLPTLDDLALDDGVPLDELADEDDELGWDREEHGRMVSYAQRTPEVETVVV